LLLIDHFQFEGGRFNAWYDLFCRIVIFSSTFLFSVSRVSASILLAFAYKRFGRFLRSIQCFQISAFNSVHSIQRFQFSMFDTELLNLFYEFGAINSSIKIPNFMPSFCKLCRGGGAL